MDASTSRYRDVYAHWQRSPEVFWAEAAAEIDWIEQPKKIFDKNAGIYGRWFTGGVCNTCYNALDRHVLAGRNDQAALIYDSPVTNSKQTFPSPAKTFITEYSPLPGVAKSNEERLEFEDP